jgi:hypothetical protein
MASGVKLRAEDEADLKVISAMLQDAIVAVCDMAFLAEDARFVLVANRFRWEQSAEGERILSGLSVEGVTAVKRRGFSPAERERLLSLLAIEWRGGTMLFDFAGGATVLLETPRIECRVEDMGAPWPTPWRPHHEMGGA